MDIEEVLASLKENPHFEMLPKGEKFQTEFKNCLEKLLSVHENDNEVLKDESFHYILPAIAAYQVMQKYSDHPLEQFRQMWLQGAQMGADYMRQAALENPEFVQNWCRNIVPKNVDAGAFLFEIVRAEEKAAEYHVKRCPYVEICKENACPELITTFCDSDDITFGNIHPSIKWGRTKTIGRGDDCCNFKFTRE